MPVRKHRPITPGQRFRAVSDFATVDKDAVPEKSLLSSKGRINGRNNNGRITMRRRGGGHKRKYREIDFRRDKLGVVGKIESIQYDPNRTANIALVVYTDGEKRYILCPQGLAKGDTVTSGSGSEIRVGNAMPLKDIPTGEMIHNIELRPGRGGQIARGAGAGVQLMAKADSYAQVRLPSGEQRKILLECFATIGVIGNIEHQNKKLGKAGVSRWLGRRPKVRGVAMNPVDHPHGGGEGKTSGGRHPVSPWGQLAKGKKTRHNKRTDKFIVRRRTK